MPPPPVLPQLRIAAPARGAFLQSPFKVEGKALAGTGALQHLTVNDAPVDLGADGSFSTAIDAAPGLVILGTRVDDDLGERAVDGRAVQVGPVHPPAAVLPRAIGLQIGPEMLDDDHPSLDDLAAVSEVVLEDPGFSQLLVGQTFPGLLDITLTGMSFSHADVDLIPQDDGVMFADVYLYDVVATFHTSFVGVGIDGSIHSTRLSLQNDVVIGGGGGGVTAQVVWSQATLEGFWWEATWVPGILEDLLDGTVRDSLESTLEQKSQALVGTLLTDALSSFAVDTKFGESLRVKMWISDALTTAQGLVLWLDASVYAEYPAFPVPDGGGSLATDGVAPSLPRVTDKPFLAAIDDDFLNQVLFAFWHSGSLGGFALSGTELSLMMGGQLPPPLGPAESASLDLGLPPILSAPTTDLAVDLAVGELEIALVREDGEHVVASVSVKAGADLVITSAGLSVSVDDRPSYMTVAAGMKRFPEALDPGDLASLFRLAVPNMLGSASQLFPAFPAPEIPIGDLVDVPALQGLTWSLTDADVQMTDTGWIVLAGRMEAPP